MSSCIEETVWEEDLKKFVPNQSRTLGRLKATMKLRIVSVLIVALVFSLTIIVVLGNGLRREQDAFNRMAISVSECKGVDRDTVLEKILKTKPTWTDTQLFYDPSSPHGADLLSDQWESPSGKTIVLLYVNMGGKLVCVSSGLNSEDPKSWSIRKETVWTRFKQILVSGM